MVPTSGKGGSGGRRKVVKGFKYKVMGRDWTSGREHTIEYIDVIL